MSHETHNAPNNVETMKSPPFLDIKPPSYMAGILSPDMPRRNMDRIVFGFPLTYERAIYRHEQERLHDPKVILHQLTSKDGVNMRVACRKVWPGSRPTKVFVYVAKNGPHGDDLLPFLSVGHTKPPPDVLERLKDALKEYGVLEEPAYFPKADGS